MWTGKSSTGPSEAVRRLSDSILFDIRLFAEDLDGSLAWAQALATAGILTEDERAIIQDGLMAIRKEFESGTFEIEAGDEDIHTAVERRLMDLVGPIAGKLHTGRSRNDQVATDFRLWVMRACDRLEDLTLELIESLVISAEAHREVPMTGYTHSRPAQVVTWGHWSLSHAWPLTRDRDRLCVAYESASVLPLGSGALAGTGFPIDRHALAKRLGFQSLSQNSLDAVSDRDFAAHFLFAAAMLGIHLSRMAETLILFASPEFGFVTLASAHVTGSSLMPQKSNPDPLELTRGKAGRLIGHLTGLLATLKGLPSAYDKDLQEDKEPVFDAFDTLTLILPALTEVITGLGIDPRRMKSAIPAGVYATDLADYLVEKGMAFREAHGTVRRAVQLAQSEGVELGELPFRTYQELSLLFDKDLYDLFNIERSIARHASIGGTSPQSVGDQLKVLRSILETPRQRDQRGRDAHRGADAD